MVNPDGAFALRDDGADGALQNTNGDHADESGDKQDEAIPLVSIKNPNQLEEGATADDATANGNKSTVKKSPANFQGLTKEELEKFAKDPFWKRLRLIFFILFWVIWVSMLAAVIIIIVVSPKCPPRPTRQFWQKPFYRLQVKSFAPTNRSGSDPVAIGSIAGLNLTSDYLRKTLGFDNFVIDSLVSADSTKGCITDFKTHNFTVGGYDLGSYETLKAFTKRGRKDGFNLMMEFDASQADIDWGIDIDKEFKTSDRFIKSLAQLPKLASRDGGSAWHSENLLHLPRAKCPSLNLNSLAVRAKLEDAMNFWLDAGLSGFVLTNVAFMSPSPIDSLTATERWFDIDPTPALFSNASVEYVFSVRSFLNAQAEKRGRELALFVDPGNTGFAQPEDRLAAYLDPKHGAHAVISTGLGIPLSTPAPAKTRSTRDVIDITLNATGSGSKGSVAFATAWPWLYRPQESYWTALSLTLPGVPCIYYGQELGMAHVPGFHYTISGLTSYLTGNDSTDQSESPMQWSDSGANAGWLANEKTPLTWVNLTIRAADIERHNLRRLSSAGHPFSQLQLVKSLVELVKTKESLQWGSLIFLTDPSVSSASSATELIAFKRQAERFPPVVVVVNPTNKPTTLALSQADSKESVGTLKVLHSSASDAAASYELHKDYDLKRVYAPANSILVFLGKE